MKKTKMITALCVLAVVLLLGIFALPAPAQAATSGYYTYSVSGGKATITDYTGSATKLTIPSTLGGYPVTSIGNYAFLRCNSLTSVTIGNRVTSIGDYAFYFCEALTSVTIGDSVTGIGDSAFEGCYSLTSVTIGDSVTGIGDSAFEACYSLTSVTIPDSVTGIGDEAFYGCTGLTSVTIDNGVTSIGDYAFSECYRLTSVTIPDSVTSIGDSAFLLCTSLKSVTIGNSVTIIGGGAFSDCWSLTGIWVNEKNINYSSDSYGVLFNKGKTTLIQAPGGISGGYTIPNSVTSIGSSAFYWCKALTSVTIPDSVTSIGNNAFNSCEALIGVTIGNSVTSIGDRAFYWCKALTSVTIPDGVTSIGDYAFGYCEALTSVTIPDSVTGIGDEAFYNCSSLTDVYYAGTEAQWKKITIGSYNSPLTSATIHYQHIHDYTLFPAVTVEPTCTQPGYIEYTCVWGDTYRQVLPAGHDITVLVNTVAPTCTEGGHSVYKCSRCDKTEKRDPVSALGHDITVLINTVEPTCTEDGYTVYKCSHCDKIEERDPVSALGHDATVWVHTVEPTCTEGGYTVYKCSRCDSTEKADYKDSVGHKLVILPAVAPTCEKTGLTMGTACQWCGLVGVAQKEVAALGGKCDYTADPTTCGNCGYVRVNISINQVVLRPTCAGLYFKGVFTFGAHETVTRYGIAVSLYNTLPVADDSDATSRYTAGQNSVLISDILGQGKTGRDLIYARPYVLLADGTYLYGNVVCTNLKSVVEAVDAKFDGLTTAQQQAIAAMYRQNTAAMQSWLIPKIKEYM